MVTKSFYFCAACPDATAREAPTVPVCRNCLSILLLGECAECSADWKDGGDCWYPSFPCHCECHKSHKANKEAIERRLIGQAFPHVRDMDEVPD